MDRRTFLKGSLVVGLAPSILKGLPEKQEGASPTCSDATHDHTTSSCLGPAAESVPEIDHYVVEVQYGDEGPHYRKLVFEPKTTFVAARPGEIVRVRVRQVDRFGARSDWVKTNQVPFLSTGGCLDVRWEE